MRPKVHGKKRILLTVTKEPYERLQENIKKAQLPVNWFSSEIDKIILTLDEFLVHLITQTKQGVEIKEKEAIEIIKKASEKFQGVNIWKKDVRKK